ncbi:MAG: Peptidase S8 protein [Candidatus Magasanikbacteria bacterium]|nr:Peptidase S8 protein [Candidatus Magasanikbacteria bacterium]
MKIFRSVTAVVMTLAVFGGQSVFTATIPNDPQWQNITAYQRMRLSDAWDVTTGSKDVIVAVMDTGVDYQHPDLQENMWNNPDEMLDGLDNDHDGHVDDLVGWDFVGNDADPTPDLRGDFNDIGVHHGTAVAGIIGEVGNNFLQGAGVAWKVKIMPLRILNNSGEGDSNNAERAIDYAIAHHADIINLSFVGDEPTLSFIQAIRRANRAGIVIVAAAGATGESAIGFDLDSRPQYPICFDDPLQEENWVVGVGAVDQSDVKTTFSNYGGCLDLMAPGTHIPSTKVFRPDKGFNEQYGGSFNGSSVAAPFVSGAAALVKSVNPSWKNKEIVNALLKSADPIERLNPLFVGKLGAGRLNIKEAVARAVAEKIKNTALIMTADFGGRNPQLRFYGSASSTPQKVLSLPRSAAGGASIASGDLNGDGSNEIIIGSGAGQAPQILVLNRALEIIRTFPVFTPKYRGGVAVASADVNNDGKDEIIVSNLSGSIQSQAQIFTGEGGLYGGFTVGDGGWPTNVAAFKAGMAAQIVTVATEKNSLSVRVWSTDGGFIRGWSVPALKAKGAAGIAIGQFDGKLFYVIGLPANIFNLVSVWSEEGGKIAQWRPFGEKFKGGVKVVAGDVNGDGLLTIVVSGGAGETTGRVREFLRDGTLIKDLRGGAPRTGLSVGVLR